MPMTEDQRAAFIAGARTLVRTPWRHRGRTERGVDCVGVVVLGLQAAGVPVNDRTAYSRDPDGTSLRAALVEQFGQPVWRRGDPVELLRAGDVVSMRWADNPSHVGVLFDYYLGGLAMVHGYAGVKQVVEHRLDAPWQACLCEGWRP